MPPLASLAASLLVASPPLAACGPPARFRRRRRRPSLPSAYPQPTLSLPSNPFPGGGDAAAAVLCSMLIVPLGLRAPHTHSWPRRPWRPAPPHTASQAKPVARSRVEPPGAVPLGAAAAPPSARGQKRSREGDTQDAETAAQGPAAEKNALNFLLTPRSSHTLNLFFSSKCVTHFTRWQSRRPT